MNAALLEARSDKSGYWDTYGGVNKNLRVTKKWGKRLAETVALLNNTKGYSTMMWQSKLLEAMTSADFPLLFADALDRELLARYRATPKQMRTVGKVARLTTMRTVKRFRQDGSVFTLPEVEEKAEYGYRSKTEDEFNYVPKKYGALIGKSWEAMINDDLGFFETLPEDLADSASNTEERLLTELLWNSAGPLDAFFADATHGQGGVSNLALNRANLGTAIEEMMGGTTGYRNTKDEPILNSPRYLVVPPALQITAEELLSDAALIGGGTGASRDTSLNVLANRGLQLIVNPWIPVLVTSGTIGSTTWALFSESIPAFELGLLRGHENPEIFVKNSNSLSISGADAGPLSGSFENDTIDYKIRMVLGKVTLDQRGGWASDGQ